MRNYYVYKKIYNLKNLKNQPNTIWPNQTIFSINQNNDNLYYENIKTIQHYIFSYLSKPEVNLSYIFSSNDN